MKKKSQCLAALEATFPRLACAESDAEQHSQPSVALADAATAAVLDTALDLELSLGWGGELLPTPANAVALRSLLRNIASGPAAGRERK